MRLTFASPPRAGILSIVLLTLSSSIAAAQTPGSVPPIPAQAQAAVAGPPAYAQLIQGKDVIIRTSDGLEYDGVFTITPTGLKKAAIFIPFDQIVRVQKNSYRVRLHTFIGLGVGAGVGFGIACSVDNCADEPFWLPVAGAAAGIGAGIGAGVGAILNAVNRQNDLIYDARRRTTTMAVVPILSPTRKGVAFSMTWR